MSEEADKFDPEVVLQGYDADEFTVDQWRMLRWCTSKEACDNYIERLPGTPNEAIIPVIKLIKSKMKGGAAVVLDSFQQQCLDRVVLYEQARSEAEKRRYAATGTRKSARHRGWSGALEAIVGKALTDEDSIGFQSLKDIGRLDASYEAFVVAHKEKFTEKTVQIAQARLDRAGFKPAS